jgi:hypothetical protein
MLGIGLGALAVAILFGSWISVWATNQTNAPYRSLPFPNELKRYEARIFTLLDKSAVDNTTKQSQYDAEFAKQFKEVLKPYLKLDPKPEKNC